MSKHYIVIENQTHFVDEDHEIEWAEQAVTDAGLAEADIWVGDGPDAVKTGGKIFGAIHEEASEVARAEKQRRHKEMRDAFKRAMRGSK